MEEAGISVDNARLVAKPGRPSLAQVQSQTDLNLLDAAFQEFAKFAVSEVGVCQREREYKERLFSSLHDILVEVINDPEKGKQELIHLLTGQDDDKRLVNAFDNLLGRYGFIERQDFSVLLEHTSAESLRDMIRSLLDATESVGERIRNLRDETKAIYQKLLEEGFFPSTKKGKLRLTVAFVAILLASYDPDQYILYRPGEYLKLLEALGVDIRTAVPTSVEERYELLLSFAGFLVEYAREKSYPIRDLLDAHNFVYITFNYGVFRFSNDQASEGSEPSTSPENSLEETPVCSLSGLAAESGIAEQELARWVRAIERKGQAILYGPPGTGKTFMAERLAEYLIGGGDGFRELVQFHPAYAYEDFIQGIRPQTSDDGQLKYPMVPGRFLEFCRKAEAKTGRCVLIIDEINRANLSRVFGEMMYLLEYRDRSIPLAGGGLFRIPRNVRIIGTMNTADRSIALVDHALRRRFAFISLRPKLEVLRGYHMKTGLRVDGLVEVLKEVNEEIGDPYFEVGISFFLRDDLDEQLEDIWRMEIEPYLEEYFFDKPDRVAKFRWDRIRDVLTSQHHGNVGDTSGNEG